ncbi:MAG: glycosyltransferase [Asticcacaulis sp.]
MWLIHANAPEVTIAMLAHPATQWNDRYRIGYWAWETSRVPASWLYIADYLHEIWVPSRFVHDALAFSLRQKGREDLIVRIRIMLHPVPVPAPGHNRRNGARARFGLDPNLCEVLCLFDTKSSAVRKNPWGALDAWQKAFPEPSTAARLTLKVVDLAGDRATEQKLLAILAGRPDIRLVSERFDDQDMDAFIAAFDVLISLHRSEGFGLTLAEAMAAGVAVIATAGSGNDDFMAGEAARAGAVASGQGPRSGRPLWRFGRRSRADVGRTRYCGRGRGFARTGGIEGAARRHGRPWIRGDPWLAGAMAE